MTDRSTTRRRFLGTTAGAGAALLTGRLVQARRVTNDTASGGIGLSQQEFESIYGSGTKSGDLFTYPNPHLDDSHVSVAFRDGVAIFIEASIPVGSGTMAEEGWRLAQKLMPEDVTRVSDCQIPAQKPDALQFLFSEFIVSSTHASGSAATFMQSCVMTAGSTNVVAGVTVSLAIPNGADQLSPAADSVGVGDTGKEWGSVHGEPEDTGAAAGNYSARYDVPPWESVLVRSHRDENGQTVITLIDAASQAGVDVDDAIAFGNSILPQGAQRQWAYEAFPTEEGPQGWGTSTWLLPTGMPMLLFTLGAGDGSGNAVRVGATIAQSTA